MYGEAEIGFVDIFVIPFIIRKNVVEHYREFQLIEHLTVDEHVKFNKFESAFMSDYAVVPTLHDPEKMILVSLSNLHSPCSRLFTLN